MNIKNIKLKDFKRFKELTISDLPELAKLVVLVGPNGCGKSSLFDAIYGKMQTFYVGFSQSSGSYYDRTSVRSDINLVFQDVEVFFHGEQPNDQTAYRKAVYVRSAHRNDPSFSIDHLENIGSSLEEIRIQRMIDNDQVTSRNYTRLVSQGFGDVFEDADSEKTFGTFREEILADIRSAIQGLFPDLILNSLGNPLSGNATFRFNKGATSGFSYENLSGGEKAAFDLILDLVVKRREYDDTVFCIDEPEAHIGLGIQQVLLKTLYRLIPDNSQLWIATHSIGMMREAHNLQKQNPNKVVFLDFDDRDFDTPQEIKPMQMDRALWKRMHSVALDDLADLILPDTLIICESEPSKGFDAACYNTIFSSEKPDVLFVSVGGKGQLESFATVFRNTSKATVLTLRDRDDLTDEGRVEILTDSVRVLSLKNIEEYLLDDEVLEKLCEKRGKPDALDELLKASQKNGDVKSSVNEVRNAANRAFQSSVGDNKDDFLINTMSKLITPEMQIYKTLKSDIFDA